MTTKTAKSGIDDDGLAWKDVEVFGATYRMREITVEESDAAWDACQNPDKTYNARLNHRMQLAASIVTPPTTVDNIGKWSRKKLAFVSQAFDALNDLPAADAEGND